MENYYIDVKDNEKFLINDKEYSDLTVLYLQCFNKIPERSKFTSWMSTNLFMLKEKETDNVIGFFKIYLFEDRFELYDVCRLYPEKKALVKNLMKKFMKKGLKMFMDWSGDVPLYLAIDKKNKYYEHAKKLYKKVGFVKTEHFKMYLLKEDSLDYRYYVLENNEDKK